MDDLDDEDILVIIPRPLTGDDIRSMPREWKEEAAAAYPRPTAFMWEETPFGPVTGTAELLQPSVEFLENCAAPPRFKLTQVEWELKPRPERIAMIRDANMAPGIALSNDMTKVLPIWTLDYLEFWQRAVNDGSAWNTLLQAEQLAFRMLQDGFILHGHCPHRAPRRDTPARADVAMSQPGSFLYVAARMGEEYARWIRDFP